MYKKTTTTIVEEHGINNSIDAPLGSVFNNIPNENTNLGIFTRLNNRNYYSLYAMYMREYLSTSFNKNSTVYIKNRITGHATNGFLQLISGWIQSPTIAQTNIDVLVTSSEAMANSICLVIDVIINNKDRDSAITNANKAITDFSTNLNNIVYLLLKDKVAAILTGYLNYVISQADNKISGEWGLDDEAYFQGFELLASASIPGIVPFSDVMTNGLVQWQPWRF